MLAPALASPSPFRSDNPASKKLTEVPVSERDGFGPSLGLVSVPCQLPSW